MDRLLQPWRQVPEPVTIEEIVEGAAKEAAGVMAGRGKDGFYGAVEMKYQAGRIVLIEVRETIKPVK